MQVPSSFFGPQLSKENRGPRAGGPREPGDLSPGLGRSLASVPEGRPNAAASSIPETSFFNRETCFFVVAEKMVTAMGFDITVSDPFELPRITLSVH